MSDSNPSRLADDFFRLESGRLVSILVRKFGVENVQTAEDVVQEAILRALRTWPYYGVPANPSAWITETAKNLALDAIRRDQLVRRKQVDMFGAIHRWSSAVTAAEIVEEDVEIDDAMLRLMFVCCHPSLPVESQTALALKTLCGFGVQEIAGAFMTSEAAVAKRITRAKEKLREGQISDELVLGDDLSERLDGVLRTLYLLFNEGYKATAGERLVRVDLCAEAIRLANVVSRHRVGNLPRTHALLALMLFHASRLGARIDPEGEILRLRDQDRGLWNREMIRQGLSHLGRSAAGGEISSLHLQASIVAVHASAADYESTDWAQILGLYNDLQAIDSSPLVTLNRAVAVAEVEGPRAGIQALKGVSQEGVLDGYYLYFAALGEFEMEAGEFEAAETDLKKALELTDCAPEKALLSKKIAACRATLAGS